jgi:hypothetical protein
MRRGSIISETPAAAPQQSCNENSPLGKMLKMSLFKGVMSGDVQTVTDALDAGAGVNWTSSVHGGLSVLMAACARGDDEIAGVLVKRGANANVKDPNLSTALMIAATACSVECVQMLLLGGADVMSVNADGRSALMLAEASQKKGASIVVEALAHAVELAEKMNAEEADQGGADKQGGVEGAKRGAARAGTALDSTREGDLEMYSHKAQFERTLIEKKRGMVERLEQWWRAVTLMMRVVKDDTQTLRQQLRRKSGLLRALCKGEGAPPSVAPGGVGALMGGLVLSSDGTDGPEARRASTAAEEAKQANGVCMARIQVGKVSFQFETMGVIEEAMDVFGSGGEIGDAAERKMKVDGKMLRVVEAGFVVDLTKVGKKKDVKGKGKGGRAAAKAAGGLGAPELVVLWPAYRQLFWRLAESLRERGLLQIAPEQIRQAVWLDWQKDVSATYEAAYEREQAERAAAAEDQEAVELGGLDGFASDGDDGDASGGEGKEHEDGEGAGEHNATEGREGEAFRESREGEDGEALEEMEGVEGAGVTKDIMMHTLFEFVDQWTEGTSMQEYIDMLDTFYEFVFGSQPISGVVTIIGMHVEDFEPMQQAVKVLVAARYGCSDRAVRFVEGGGSRGRRPGRMYEREVISPDDGIPTMMDVPSTIVPFLILNAKQLADWEARLARERAEAEARRKAAAAAAAAAAAIAASAVKAAMAAVTAAELELWLAQLRAAEAARLRSDALRLEAWRRGWGGANVWGGAGSVGGTGRLRRRHERKKLHRFYDELVMCAKVDDIGSKETEELGRVARRAAAAATMSTAAAAREEGAASDEDVEEEPAVTSMTSIFGFEEEERIPLTVEAALALSRAVDAAFDAAAVATALAISAAAVVADYEPEWAEEEQLLLSQRSKIRRNVWNKISEQRWTIYRRRLRWEKTASEGNRRVLHYGICEREWERLRAKEKAGIVKERNWWHPPHRHPGQTWWKGKAEIPRRARSVCGGEGVGAEEQQEERNQIGGDGMLDGNSDGTHDGYMQGEEEAEAGGLWAHQEGQGWRCDDFNGSRSDEDDASSAAELDEHPVSNYDRNANTREAYYTRALSVSTPLPAESNCGIAHSHPHVRRAASPVRTAHPVPTDASTDEFDVRESCAGMARGEVPGSQGSTYARQRAHWSPEVGFKGGAHVTGADGGGVQDRQSSVGYHGKERPVGSKMANGGGEKKKTPKKKKIGQLERYCLITHDHTGGRRIKREFARSRRRRRQHAPITPSLCAATLVKQSMGDAAVSSLVNLYELGDLSAEQIGASLKERVVDRALGDAPPHSESLPAMLRSSSGGLGVSQLRTVLALRQEQSRRAASTEVKTRKGRWQPPPTSADPLDLVV